MILNGASGKDIKVITISKASKYFKFTVHKTRCSPHASNSIGTNLFLK